MPSNSKRLTLWNASVSLSLPIPFIKSQVTNRRTRQLAKWESFQRAHEQGAERRRRYPWVSRRGAHRAKPTRHRSRRRGENAESGGESRHLSSPLSSAALSIHHLCKRKNRSFFLFHFVSISSQGQSRKFTRANHSSATGSWAPRVRTNKLTE